MFKIASFNSCSTIRKSSATLDITNVSEIGRICLCKPVTCLTFGKCAILALFHCFGNFSARKEQFKRKLTGYAKTSAKCLRNYGAILSGPELLLELRDFNLLKVPVICRDLCRRFLVIYFNFICHGKRIITDQKDIINQFSHFVGRKMIHTNDCIKYY